MWPPRSAVWSAGMPLPSPLSSPPELLHPATTKRAAARKARINANRLVFMIVSLSIRIGMSSSRLPHAEVYGFTTMVR